MRKKCITAMLTLSILLIFSNTFSQGIMFENIKWVEVLKMAKDQHKLIFLQLQSDECLQCNDVADMAFKNDSLGNYFNTLFISIKLNGAKTAGAELVKKYAVSGLPVSLFIDENENLLNRYVGSTNATTIYIKQANIALSRNKETPLSTYENEYRLGNRSLPFLESYIKKMTELKMPVDTLLQEYVSVLPKDSLNSYSVNNFIFDQAPELDSRAYQVMRSSHNLNTIYKNAGQKKASEINNKIIYKTRQKAIQLKDFSLAKRVASFTKDTWGKDTSAGRRSYDYQMMEYYRGTKQTDEYISSAILYYDNYYMSKNLDSLKLAEDAAIQKYLNSMSLDSGITKIGNEPSGIMVERQVVTISRKFEFGSELNTAAWNFYKITSDKKNLQKALSWVQKAIDYHEDPAYIDTYAHLLYKLGRKKEAVKAEKKAIDILSTKMNGRSITQYKIALEKMKNNTLENYD